MKKILLATVALSTLAAAPALAADLARPAPPPPPVAYKAPPPIYIYSWTGCYIGGNGGGLWAKKDWTADAADPVFAAGSSFGSHNPSSGIAGAQVGCDYQFAGGFVVGIAGDYEWAYATGRSGDALNNAFFVTTGFIDQSRIRSLASVTGRIGYAWDRFLGYVKGGGAWERDEYSIFNPLGFEVGFAEETRSGWTVGIGGEYAFLNWFSVFAEYDYYNFGTRSNTLVQPGTGLVFDVVNVKETKNVFKAGLNFRWGPGPVVAAY
jgi:outer membrane immunogenic protein